MMRMKKMEIKRRNRKVIKRIKTRRKGKIKRMERRTLRNNNKVSNKNKMMKMIMVTMIVKMMLHEKSCLKMM